MTRQEYLQALGPAIAARRVALNWSTLAMVVVDVGLGFWLFHLIEVRDQSLELKAAIGFGLVTLVMIATMAYMGAEFARYSPICHECGKHVRYLQRLRVRETGKCAHCNAQMFEA